MTWPTVFADNLAPAAIGVLIIVVSFNRLLGMLWPFALAIPLVPVFSVAYSGYPSSVYLWSYVPIILVIVVRIKLGTFPRAG